MTSNLASTSSSGPSVSTRRKRQRTRVRDGPSNFSFASAGVAVAAAALLAIAPAAQAQSTYTLSLTPPAQSTLASPISEVLASNFVGFGIEPTSLFEFAGGATPNPLTYNLLSNMANYTGVPPHLRIGGNAGDQQVYSNSIGGYTIQENPSGDSDQTNAYLFGPNYFKVFNNFPTDTPITYHINLAYQGSGWQDLMVSTAAAALDGMTTSKIVGFELGNEPDLFVTNGYRTSSNWSAAAFALQWQAVALDIYDNVLKSRNIGTNFFEPAGTATTATTNGHPYRIDDLVDSAIAIDNGIYISGWNQHDYYYYVGVSTYTLTTALLLDLSTTVSQFAEWKQQSAQAYATGKAYYLREMNSIGPTGLVGISPTFAQTLWVFNFHLYAATVGVANVHMHMTTYSWGAAWLPIQNASTAPHVRSSYYAYAAVAQLIGATCDVQIASQSLSNAPSGYSDNLAAYTKYQGGALQSLILVNTMPAYSGSSMNTVQVSYNVPSWAGKTVYVSYLSAAGVDATENTTWNGLSYEVSGTGLATPVSSAVPMQLTVSSAGVLTVPVRDSQVAVANLGYRIGTTNSVVNSTNCAVAAAATSAGATAATATFSTVKTNPYDGAVGAGVDLRTLLLVALATLAGGVAVFL
ncbi:hypothetical protein BCV69DRAFT_199828 [Microstroma glucosiphilum]|uniref:Beta-glucuronidase C-terminal domain-containing protein n=1 Tax=Pseudomicrostroma glucosiphilum TaxID=1684307 RepID=A0A316U6B7_9BASI|nr:hypothetical protein BCV69DRAFT_199828 [Pseudomicrostroma glucosiphilum]PWN20807.1 hypothetical protein BCV69DRAFT_199828 [Pseudomicrostroma glucosiphilum]